MLVILPTLEMTTAQVVEMSVTVNNGPIQDYANSEYHIALTHEILTLLNFVIAV